MGPNGPKLKFPKGNFRPNEGPSVDPGAVNEVVKSFNMVPLVRPDVYP